MFASHRDTGRMPLCDEAGSLNPEPKADKTRAETASSLLQNKLAASLPKRARYRTAALIWSLALLIGSLQPSRPAHIHFGTIHHMAHILGFGLLAVLLAAASSNRDRVSYWPPAAVFVFGLTIELLQHWLYRIPLEWCDVRDDAIGIVAFTVLYQLWRHRLNGSTDALEGTRLNTRSDNHRSSFLR